MMQETLEYLGIAFVSSALLIIMSKIILQAIIRRPADYYNARELEEEELMLNAGGISITSEHETNPEGEILQETHLEAHLGDIDAVEPEEILAEVPEAVAESLTVQSADSEETQQTDFSEDEITESVPADESVTEELSTEVSSEAGSKETESEPMPETETEETESEPMSEAETEETESERLPEAEAEETESEPMPEAETEATESEPIAEADAEETETDVSEVIGPDGTEPEESESSDIRNSCPESSDEEYSGHEEPEISNAEESEPEYSNAVMKDTETADTGSSEPESPEEQFGFSIKARTSRTRKPKNREEEEAAAELEQMKITVEDARAREASEQDSSGRRGAAWTETYSEIRDSLEKAYAGSPDRSESHTRAEDTAQGKRGRKNSRRKPSMNMNRRELTEIAEELGIEVPEEATKREILGLIYSKRRQRY